MTTSTQMMCPRLASHGNRELRGYLETSEHVHPGAEYIAQECILESRKASYRIITKMLELRQAE